MHLIQVMGRGRHRAAPPTPTRAALNSFLWQAPLCLEQHSGMLSWRPSVAEPCIAAVVCSARVDTALEQDGPLLLDLRSLRVLLRQLQAAGGRQRQRNYGREGRRHPAGNGS